MPVCLSACLPVRDGAQAVADRSQAKPVVVAVVDPEMYVNTQDAPPPLPTSKPGQPVVAQHIGLYVNQPNAQGTAGGAGKPAGVTSYDGEEYHEGDTDDDDDDVYGTMDHADVAPPPAATPIVTPSTSVPTQAEPRFNRTTRDRCTVQQGRSVGLHGRSLWCAGTLGPWSRLGGDLTQPTEPIPRRSRHVLTF